MNLANVDGFFLIIYFSCMEKKKEYTAPKMTIHNLNAQIVLLQASQPDAGEVSNTEFD